MHIHHVLSLFVIVVSFIFCAEAQSVVCPAVRTTSGWLDLFPLPCKKNAECRGVMGPQYLCCNRICTKGIAPTAAPQRSNGQPSSVVESSSTSTSTTTTTTSTTTTTTTTPSTTSSTTTTPKPTTEPPRPFLQLLPIQTTPRTSAPVKTSSDIVGDINYSYTRNSVTGYEYNVDYSGKTQKLVCPKPGQAPVLLFPIPCENNGQCRASSGPGNVCCEGRCIKGIPAPRPTSAPKPHQPLLGVIPRECPKAPLGELLFEVQTCKADSDCWPRICCPDGTRSYCRTSRARLDLVPVVNQIDAPVRMLQQYLQCTSPPVNDLFPQRCSSSVDCFPNLCCAEGGKKHCRPAKRSLFALLTGVAQGIGSTIVNFQQAQANANKV